MKDVNVLGRITSDDSGIYGSAMTQVLILDSSWSAVERLTGGLG